MGGTGLLATSAMIAVPGLAGPAGGPAAAALITPTVSCTSTAHPTLATSLARDIQRARNTRSSTVAVWVRDPRLGITCSLSGSRHFDSASIVKVTIMGAVLRKALDQHRYLTSTEATELRAMITRSDNTAASALWNELGHPYLQHFLTLAGMTQTVLGTGGYWGLTQATARDEARMLRLLLRPNTVLSDRSRAYALGLMAQVIPTQRWGVPAGAPRTVTVHVKDGWLLRATHGWRINSIGGFTRPTSWYSIVVLSTDNPTMAYGINTVESIATVVHHDLNPTVTTVVPRSVPNPTWGRSDEHVPAEVPTP